MRVKFYNTLARKKEIFRPLRKDWVGLYTCGPTVYNFTHIGNLRTYIFEDVLRRTLEYAGFRVRHIMNLTDIEDKIIRDAARANKNIFEFVKPYEAAFFNDLKKLHIKRAWKYPKATEHIQEMVAVIDKLLKRGLAYQADGSTYFDISKFKSYGKLSRVGSRKLKAGARVDSDEYAKDNVQDFVLWKATKPGEPSWDAKLNFGRPAPPKRGEVRPLRGRPGWHIECSAMSMKYLGSTFDIHAGGVDLIFPHHENEIAQSEGATQKLFARFFVEGEHLLVNGKKMSKSLGNVFILRDIEMQKINPIAFRYLVLTSHYRSKLNFTWESIAASQKSLNHLYNFIGGLAAQNQNAKFNPFDKLRVDPEQSQRIKNQNDISKFKKDFEVALFNDLDTPKALAVIWEFIRQYNKNQSRFNPRKVLKLFYDFDKVLGLGFKNLKSEKIPEKFKKLALEREKYRIAKEWQRADEVRKKIQQGGFEVKDTPTGPKINPFDKLRVDPELSQRIKKL